jgi:hypothetical protein
MAGFALQPARLASRNVAEHYANTIVNPVRFADHRDLLPLDTLSQLERLFPEGQARMWGVAPGLNGSGTTRFAQLRPGDGVAFYGEGKLYAAGRIAVIFHNPKLAERLWGRTEEGQTWEHMYAVMGFHDVHIGVRDVQRIMGWRERAVVQQFRLADSGDQVDELASLCSLDLDAALVPEQAYAPVTSPTEHADWLPDSPAASDALKRTALAKVLASRLRHIRDEGHDSDVGRPDQGEAFLIHIDGPWGAGKSTLLRLLGAELKTEFVVVKFDAWRNVRVDPPWWALLTALREALVRPLSRRRRFELRLRESWARAKRTGAPAFLALFLLLPVVVGFIAVLNWGIDAFITKVTQLDTVADTISKWAQVGTGLIGLGGVLFAGALAVSRFLLWDSAKGAKLFEQGKADPMQDIAEHFAWLLKQTDRPIVFFIDDLDRCGETAVVTLLEAVQTLIRTAPPDQRELVSFVVAADGAWLRQAFETVYDHFRTAVEAPGRPLGYLFLDKLFQLRVPVPTMGSASQSAYFRSLLGLGSGTASDVVSEASDLRQQVTASKTEHGVLQALRHASPAARELVAADALTKMSEAELTTDVEHALEPYALMLNANPRSMKRYINCYTVARAARTLEGNPVETDALALWVLLQIRWPQLADYLQTSPDAISKIVQGKHPSELPDPLHRLVVSPDLTNVLKAAPIPLTPDLIRHCSGIGFEP